MEEASLLGRHYYCNHDHNILILLVYPCTLCILGEEGEKAVIADGAELVNLLCSTIPSSPDTVNIVNVHH